jgi:hypothetical protein
MTYVKGTFDSVRIYDMTNYPDTSKNSNIYDVKSEMFRLNGLLKFESRMFSNPDLRDNVRVSTNLDIELEKLQLNLMLQPLMRLIDFINNQIIGVMFVEID